MEKIRVGGRLPADRTVSGKTLLAWMEPEVVDSVMTLQRERSGRPIDLVPLHRELDRIRGRRGLAIDAAEQCGMGITAVAAPIMGPTGPVGAISLATRGNQPAQAIGPMVVRAARQLSGMLSPTRAPRVGATRHADVVAVGRLATP